MNYMDSIEDNIIDSMNKYKLFSQNMHIQFKLIKSRDPPTSLSDIVVCYIPIFLVFVNQITYIFTTSNIDLQSDYFYEYRL